MIVLYCQVFIQRARLTRTTVVTCCSTIFTFYYLHVDIASSVTCMISDIRHFSFLCAILKGGMGLKIEATKRAIYLYATFTGLVLFVDNKEKPSADLSMQSYDQPEGDSPTPPIGHEVTVFCPPCIRSHMQLQTRYIQHVYRVTSYDNICPSYGFCYSTCY